MPYSPSGFWVVVRIDQGGGYLALPGSAKTWIKDKSRARRFSSYEYAQAECYGNEVPVPL